MSKTTPTWMLPDGKAGQILALLCEAAREAGIVPRSQSRQVGDHYDIGSMERAARIWQAHGIVTIPETSEEIVEQTYKSEKGTVIVCARVRYSLTLVAPDGSWVEAHVVGAGNSHGGRHFAMARTDARKEAIRCLLQMASEESETVHEANQAGDAPETWSDCLRKAVAAIDACADAEELAAVGRMEIMGHLSPDERAFARLQWKRRQDDLRQLGVLVTAEDMRASARGRR